jgi:transcription antitermination factor NusG
MAETWGLIWTAARAEETAAAALRRIGVETYLPTARHLVRRSRHVKQATVEMRVPVFPRYLFVGIDRPDWQRLRSASGVSAIVAIRGEPVMIGRREIEDVMAAEDMGLFDEAVADGGPTVRLRIGDAVELVGGAMIGYTGSVVAVPPSQARRIRVEICGLPVSVSLDQIRKLA